MFGFTKNTQNPRERTMTALPNKLSANQKDALMGQKHTEPLIINQANILGKFARDITFADKVEKALETMTKNKSDEAVLDMQTLSSIYSDQLKLKGVANRNKELEEEIRQLKEVNKELLEKIEFEKFNFDKREKQFEEHINQQNVRIELYEKQKSELQQEIERLEHSKAALYEKIKESEEVMCSIHLIINIT